MSVFDARTASTLARIRRNYRSNTQLDATQAVLGDEYGRVSVDGQSEYYYVRIINGENSDGSSQYGRAFPVLAGAGYMGSEQIGTEVYIGVAYDGQWAILGTDRSALIEKGVNPRAENVNSPYRQFVYMKNADLFNATPLGTVQTPTLEVRVEPSWYISYDGTFAMFAGGVIDLAGDVPAADGDANANHLISAVFINSSGTLESVTSTAKLTDNQITWDVDVLEAFGNRSARAIPIRYYKLYTGQTLLTKADDFGDGREWITAPTLRNNFAATAAPAVTDDIDLRYEVGSKWFDVTNDVIYECIDSTDGAAIWKQIALLSSGVLPIAQGGTNSATAQDAINTLSAVSGATDEHVLTKDTATGNAQWKASSDGTMSSFDLSADGGASETVTDAATVEIAGGTNISTVVGATNKVTVNVDDVFLLSAGDTATGKILIDLSSDEEAIIIDGDAAQTAELQQWRTSAGEVGVAISPNAKALRFWDVGASHYVGFTPPSLAATQLWVLPTADGAADEVLKTDGSGNLGWVENGSGSSPLTTKGDLYSYDSDNNRLPVGSDGQVLVCDSSEALGVKWVDPETSGAALKFIEEETLTASTGFSFSGLGTGYHRYLCKGEIDNNSATTLIPEVRINGDATSADYAYQELQSSGSTTTSARGVNSGRFAGLSGNSHAVFDLDIRLVTDGGSDFKFVAFSTVSRWSAADTPIIETYAIIKNTSISSDPRISSIDIIVPASSMNGFIVLYEVLN